MARASAAPIPKGALRYLRGKRRKPSRHWTDVWREEHATAFTVAQMTQDALLEEVHQALLRALRKGETLESFMARLQPWLEQRGWAPKGRGGDIPTRLRRIYNTNLRTARAAGQWDRIARNAELQPYLVYELGPSSDHRPEHEAWAGLCLRVDDPWWSTHYPPNGWGCKCRVRPVAKPPEGAVTTAPETALRDWKNPATGKVRRVAVGIDPGWDYHVGAHRTLGANAALLRRAERAVDARGVEAAAGLVERHVAGPGFQWFVERPRPKGLRWEARPGLIEATPAGVLSPAAASRMGAVGPVVRLTEKAMHEQARRKLPAELYARLPEVLRSAPRRRRSKAGPRWEFGRAVLVDGRRRDVRAVVEVDADGRASIVSVRYARKKAAAAAPAPEPDPARLAPAAARERLRESLAGHERRLGVPAAKRRMDAARETWRAIPPERMQERGRAWGVFSDAMDRWLEGRQRAETAVWREMFGGRDPAPGMPVKWVGEAPEEWRAAAAGTVYDFRRMVPAEKLARIGEVEIERKMLSGWGDAGLVYRNEVHGFELERFESRRIRVSPDAPTRTTTFDFVGQEYPTTAPIPTRGSEVVVHELGHHLEHVEPGLLDKAVAFQDLRERNPARFPVHGYAAKRYAGGPGGRATATEVVSVGVEQLYRRPGEFAKEDPEFFDFIWENVVGGGAVR